MENGNVGSYEIIDLDLARYDVLAERLAAVRDDTVLPESGISTQNAAFNRMIAEIEQVALNSPSPHSAFRPDRRRQIETFAKAFPRQPKPKQRFSTISLPNTS